MINETTNRFKPIQDVYPNGSIWQGSNNSAPGIYDPLLESFGYEFLVKQDEYGHNGDSFVLFGDGDKRGILIFGWGSCSGCDALLGCESYDEIEQLRNKLHNEIRWFQTAKHCLEYYEKHDWEGDFVFHVAIWERFAEKCKSFLKEEIGENQ